MANLNNFMNLSDELSANAETASFMSLINTIMGLDDSTLNDEAVEVVTGAINGAFTPKLKESAVKSLVEEYRSEGVSRHEANERAESLIKDVKFIIEEELKPSKYKALLIENVFLQLYNVLKTAAEVLTSFDIEIPIMLDEGAKMPTYAHETDAAADLYAREDMVIPAHSFSNKISTGIHLQLPENWKAHIAPRSSIGAKTPLRLSNMLAVIDPSYTGDLILLYDNLSDSDYHISAGDRIAQLWVEPVYRFKGVQTDSLVETDRNDGGLGSTGK